MGKETKNLLFAAWKPKGPSSAGLLQEIKRATGVRKIGHAGTLDPLASGILVIGTGSETKKLSGIVSKEKEYIADIFFGVSSTTDDMEGIKVECKSINPPTLQKITDITQQFIGVIEQIPPQYSAVKISGKEAYKYARSGKEIILKPRKIIIKNINVFDYSWPKLRIKVTTGPGAYIRALARDLGKELGTCAYLADLERIRVGPFSKADSITVSEAIKKLQS